MLCEPDCGTANVVLEAPPPAVMLVLDKSGSMVNNSWDHDGDPGTMDETRWATLYTVTDFILTNFESSIKFGLQLFPSTAATTSCANDPACPACDVAATPEVPIAIDNRAAILAAMPAMSADSDSVAGATPAAGGMVNAKAALDDAVANGDAHGPATPPSLTQRVLETQPATFRRSTHPLRPIVAQPRRRPAAGPPQVATATAHRLTPPRLRPLARRSPRRRRVE